MSRDCCNANALVVTIVVIVAAAVVLASTMIISVLVMAVIPTITMMFLVTRNILPVVPVVLHKEDPLAAGVVLAAVFAPVFRVAWGHTKIDRRAAHRYPLDYHRLTIDRLWLRIAADVEATIEARLANAEGNTDIARGCRNRRDGQCRCE
jgi:hypothetical protein